MFWKANNLNGWMNLHSPHGFKLNGIQWKSAAEAWYCIIHDLTPQQFAAGHYTTRGTNKSDDEKYSTLLSILSAKLDTHPILKEYLIETGNEEIVYYITKFASDDQKWLGITIESRVGDNNLGNAWMELRQSILEAKQ